ncbi:S-adenosyl-L-methionine-dependent methyltransferase [Hysterangium stoloniferum]|nr:S-adenosyl-L-methionine-dependent methyltransferase [Hysterangium stoloniferum]
MKFSNVISPLSMIWMAIWTAFRPTLCAIIESPSLLLSPKRLSRISFYHLWTGRGDETFEMNNEVKARLITTHARGVVLDVGAGMGHTSQFLPKNKVTKYVALEPNALMHSYIRKIARESGYTEEEGTLVILSCGAEAYETISHSLGGDHKVDTIVSILAFCSIPQAEKTLEHLVDKILKPGGEFLFREHVAHKRSDVRFWQSVWTPLWTRFFDGCKLNCPTDVYIKRLPFWQPFPEVDANGERTGIWEEESHTMADEEIMFQQVGRFVKREA